MGGTSIPGFWARDALGRGFLEREREREVVKLMAREGPTTFIPFLRRTCVGRAELSRMRIATINFIAGVFLLAKELCVCIYLEQFSPV